VLVVPTRGLVCSLLIHRYVCVSAALGLATIDLVAMESSLLHSTVAAISNISRIELQPSDCALVAAATLVCVLAAVPACNLVQASPAKRSRLTLDSLHLDASSARCVYSFHKA
jgi:hypothetical protein